MQKDGQADDHLRYTQQTNNVKLHIGACCRVIQRLGPAFFGKSDPKTKEQRNYYTTDDTTCEGSRCLYCGN